MGYIYAISVEKEKGRVLSYRGYIAVHLSGKHDDSRLRLSSILFFSLLANKALSNVESFHHSQSASFEAIPFCEQYRGYRAFRSASERASGQPISKCNGKNNSQCVRPFALSR